MTHEYIIAIIGYAGIMGMVFTGLVLYTAWPSRQLMADINAPSTGYVSTEALDALIRRTHELSARIEAGTEAIRKEAMIRQ